ncbi:hypothetical protein [Xinfangfangia pollutisoli]|uniref:hypothetical protein n=1 Tax=Xinfangfangia pollutisoli TaxID=2865960 RepID=UPI001CD7168E|nr:hypothetical protein [Xinfangfangia pollutisoli]
MPLVTFKNIDGVRTITISPPTASGIVVRTDGVVVIGPLADDTDFQVRDGSCLFSPADPDGDTNFGFEIVAGRTAEFFLASGKTAYLQGRSFTIFFEVLG